MLNGYPLNTVPLNSMPPAEEATPPVEPAVPVDPAGHRVRWSVTVLMGGDDVTGRLTGAVTVDREEGAAGVAEFRLWYPQGEPVPVDMHDQPVSITLSDDEGDLLLFTGHAAEPHWDAVSRTMRVVCSDMLQQRIEGMTAIQIDALCGGLYSADISGEIDGHWDYAQDRMRSRMASMDCAPDGSIRVTDWHAGSPAYIFGAGTTVYESVTVDLAQKANVINTVELSMQYRYDRFHEAVDAYKWEHPTSDFCAWRQWTTELPDIDMVFSAASNAGLTLTKATWNKLPPSGVYICDGPVSWQNKFTGLLLGFEIEGTRRWSQSVTEKYGFTVRLGSAESVTQRMSYSAATDAADKDNWRHPAEVGQEGGTAEQEQEAGDRDDDGQRENFILAGLHHAQAAIVDSHRQTRVSWQLPCSSKVTADLVHALELNDQGVHAIGKCVRRVDQLDIETGSALTDLTIAVMRGGGISEVLVVPERIGADAETSHVAELVGLPTQLGGRFTSPAEYDEELDGFSGQYTAVQDSMLPIFPRRLAITTEEYTPDPDDPEDTRADLTSALDLDDEFVVQVGVPDDTLEL